MKRRASFFCILSLLFFTLSGCSLVGYNGGHFITAIDTVYFPMDTHRNPSPKEAEDCYTHKGRAGASFYFTLTPALWTIDKAVYLAPLAVPVSIAFDIAFSPFAFLWGIESGVEHWFGRPRVPPLEEN